MTNTVVERPVADRNVQMKGPFRIFELTKNEQRVVLIVMLILLTIAFVGYQRRVHRNPVQMITSATELKPSPSPVENER